MSDKYVMTSPTMLKRNSQHNSYMVISYSHEDGRLLDALLTALYAKGANYWYDTEMHIGDNWKDKILEYIRVEKGCRGIVFFVSVNYLISESCGWELAQFLAKRETDSALRAYVVLVDVAQGDPLNDLYTKAKNEMIARLVAGNADSTAVLDSNKENLSKILNKNDNLFLVLNETSLQSVADKLYSDVFRPNGCTANVNEALSGYAQQCAFSTDNERVIKNGRPVIKNHFSIEFGHIVDQTKHNEKWTIIQNTAVPAVWTVYNLKNGYFSLLLKSKPMGACGRILAKSKLQSLQDEKCYLLWSSPDGKSSKCLIFDEFEKQQLIGIRFLYKEERQNEDLADDINWALSRDFDSDNQFDPDANGYFFVMSADADNRARFYYADRFSTDVYEHVWRDEIASVIPVIDIKPPVD